MSDKTKKAKQLRELVYDLESELLFDLGDEVELKRELIAETISVMSRARKVLRAIKGWADILPEANALPCYAEVRQLLS